MIIYIKKKKKNKINKIIFSKKRNISLYRCILDISQLPKKIENNTDIVEFNKYCCENSVLYKIVLEKKKNTVKIFIE